VFEDCQSLSSWTKASTASLLTALSPIEHRAVDEDDVLPAEVSLIWEPFHQAGYATALLSTNGHISERWGFRRGIDHYRYFAEDHGRQSLHCPADSVHNALLDWIDSRGADPHPFFAYVHATDPHIPYTPPSDLIPAFYPPGIPAVTEVSVRRLGKMMCPGNYEPWELDAARALYDAEIAGWERSFTHLLDALRRRGLLERTAIFLTSDHGEEFAEHGGFSHGTTLYGEQVRIPLLARVPGFRGGRSAISIDHRDVSDLIQWVVEARDPLQWAPRPRLRREAHLSLRGIAMARLQGPEFSAIWNIRRVGICDHRLREMEFYADDPLESRETFGARSASARACRGALAAWVKLLPSLQQSAVVLDKENIERLRILGYMTDDLAAQ
jgi:hypothetical protein